MKKHLGILLATTFTSISHSFSQNESFYELSASANWDSKYISEGRDNLEDGGLSHLP